MAELLHGSKDRIIRQILRVLERYEVDHPEALISLYRHSSVSVRIRIIDRAFEGLSKAERSNQVWQFLHRLPENVQSEITLLLLFTPDETRSSLANMDFERPLPSAM